MTSDSADIVYVDEPPPDDAVVDAGVVAPTGVPCDSCGAPIEPGDHFCPHCGVASGGAPVAAKAGEVAQKHIECQTCGAQITTDPDQRSYTCPFCDSTYVTENVEVTTGRQPPEFVIGFAITPDDALERFRQWLRDNSLFRPGDLAMAEIEGKLRGVYLPFWRFTMRSHSQWSAQIGEYWYRTETYTTTDSKGRRVTRTRRVRETEWWGLAGQHHHYHRDYLVSGSKGLPQKEALRIGPFNLPALKRYESFYIAGWITEEYSVDQQQAIALCREEFQRRERAAIASFLPGDTHSDLRVTTRFSDPTSDLCLLPVYLLSYRYQEKVYRFLLNGQTGRLDGDKPWSWKRIYTAIGLGVGLLAIVIIIVLILAGVFASHG